MLPLLGLPHCHLIATALPPRLVPMLAFIFLFVLHILSILNWSYSLCTKHSFLQCIVGIGKHNEAKPISHICLKEEYGFWLVGIPTIKQILLKIIYVLCGWSLPHFSGKQCSSIPLYIVRGDEVVQYVRLHGCKYYCCLVIALTIKPSMCSACHASFGKQGLSILVLDAS